MYEIYYDEQIIGSLAADELVYFNGSLQQRTNEADTLSFSLTSNNPYLKNLGIRSGVVSLRKNRETVFAGDIVETVEDFYNCVTVTCHGCLTWFKDVQIVHYKKNASASDYLSDILSKYNAACSPQRKINMGYCDISKSVSHDHSDSIRSASYLLNEILEECGGYLVFRYDGQTVYLDWIAEGRDCNQNIDSQNLIDLSKHIDGTNIVTRIYPWGKDGLTMAAPYYVADELLEMYYGIISIDKKYEVETAAELKAKAEAELAQQKAVQSTITLTAVDLSIQNRSLDSFEIAGKVPAISKPHGIEETMVVQEKDLDLNNPANSKVTFGVLAVPLSATAGTSITEATVSGWGFTKNTGTYAKPALGIPKTDLASAVQTSLGKADSALQSVPSTYRTASAQDTIDSGKVDKVAGKVLSTNDFTAAAKAKVDAIPANPKYTDTVYDDTAVRNRLTAVEGMDNITLSVVSSRLTSLAYTAKYSSLLGIVFVRIYGKVNATMNTGYDYNVLNIGSKSPTANAALAVKCGKNAQAIAQSSGVISVRPFESGINGYDIYITGFWFV